MEVNGIKIEQGADLSNADLSSEDLSNANLSNANLTFANLSSANLSSANLSSANLSSANLSSANLTSAQLSFTDFSFANLRTTNLTSATLAYADLSHSVMFRAILGTADLTCTDLSSADLTYANLVGAELSSANLTGANLSFADLTGADLSFANMRDADLTGANLTGVNMLFANMHDANLTGANLTGANFLGVNCPPDEISTIVKTEDSSTDKSAFDDWFLCGVSLWCESISQDFFTGSQKFFEDLFSNGAVWSDPSCHLFDDYHVEPKSLEESLARAESLSPNFHLYPNWPIYLETADLSVAMTINGDFLLAWVGKGLEGLVVGINVRTWDTYQANDIDALFAVGVALNWFLDCSLNIKNHQMFEQTSKRWTEFESPWGPENLTTWSATSTFRDDIESIRNFDYHAPPSAHRVRGHIRTLTERLPTDEARENAPSYIRRNMGLSDTFVRSYTKGGDLTTEKLLLHLKTKSSLADFLGTAPLMDED